MDCDEIIKLTGNPVLSEHEPPTIETRPTPPDAWIVSATFNTLCKLSQGIADNYALSRLAAAITKEPVVIIPAARDYADRKPYHEAVRHLTSEGVLFVNDYMEGEEFPWNAAFTKVEQLYVSSPLHRSHKPLMQEKNQQLECAEGTGLLSWKVCIDIFNVVMLSIACSYALARWNS